MRRTSELTITFSNLFPVIAEADDNGGMSSSSDLKLCKAVSFLSSRAQWIPEIRRKPEPPSGLPYPVSMS